MFEHYEQRHLGADVERVAQALPHAVYQGAGLQVVPVPILPAPGATSAWAWQGSGVSGSWGLTPEIWARVVGGPQGTQVELRIGVRPETTTVVVGILLLLFFWPAALICGLIAQQDFQQKKDALLFAIWGHLGHMSGAPPVPFVGGGFSGNYR